MAFSFNISTAIFQNPFVVVRFWFCFVFEPGFYVAQAGLELAG